MFALSDSYSVSRLLILHFLRASHVLCLQPKINGLFTAKVLKKYAIISPIFAQFSYLFFAPKTKPQQKPPPKNHPYFLKTKTFLSGPKIHCGVFEESVKNRSIHHGGTA